MSRRIDVFAPVMNYLNFDDENLQNFVDYSFDATKHLLRIKGMSPYGAPALVILGEQGSGKTLAAHILAGLMPHFYDASTFKGRPARVYSDFIEIEKRFAVVSHEDFGAFIRAIEGAPLFEKEQIINVSTRLRSDWAMLNGALSNNHERLEKVLQQTRLNFWKQIGIETGDVA